MIENFLQVENISVGQEIHLSDEKSVSSDEKYFCRSRNLFVGREIFFQRRMFLSVEISFVDQQCQYFKNGQRISDCELRTGYKTAQNLIFMMKMSWSGNHCGSDSWVTQRSLHGGWWDNLGVQIV